MKYIIISSVLIYIIILLGFLYTSKETYSLCNKNNTNNTNSCVVCYDDIYNSDCVPFSIARVLGNYYECKNNECKINVIDGLMNMLNNCKNKM
jgi:hypothetical protein